MKNFFENPNILATRFVRLVLAGSSYTGRTVPHFPLCLSLSSLLETNTIVTMIILLKSLLCTVYIVQLGWKCLLIWSELYDSKDTVYGTVCVKFYKWFAQNLTSLSLHQTSGCLLAVREGFLQRKRPPPGLLDLLHLRYGREGCVLPRAKKEAKAVH